MNKVIDLFSSVSSWTYSVVGAPEVPVYLNYDINKMSGINDACAAIRFNTDNGNYVENVYNVDLTGYTEIHLMIYSDYGRRTYTNLNQFRYKIDLGLGTEFYLNTRMGLDKVIIAIPAGQTTLSKIKITCLHDDLEYLYISAAYVVKPEYRIDAAQAVCDTIGDIKINIGKVTALTGDSTITLITPTRDLDSDMRIEFNGEIHQIKSALLDGKVKFSDFYDGETVLSDVTNGDVYLLMSPLNMISDNRIVIPGVAVSIPYIEKKQIEGQKGKVYDTYTSTSVQVRKPTRGANLIIQIDAESEDEELLSLMETKILDLFENDGVIIHGEYFAFDTVGAPVYMQPDVEGIVPKITYRISLFQGVNEWPRINQSFPVVETVTINRPTLPG